MNNFGPRSPMDGETYMRGAIAKAKEGIAAGQSPFGAVVVRGDRVIAAAHNTVWRDKDPTAHAEVNVLRQAAAVSPEPFLKGCSLFSTCEPCPMCLAACHWAKLERVYFGASIEDATKAGFSELPVGAQHLAALGRSHLLVQGGLLMVECRELFELWRSSPFARPY